VDFILGKISQFRDTEFLTAKIATRHRIHRRSVFLRLQLAASCSRSFFARLWLSAAARMDVGSQLGNDELIQHLLNFLLPIFFVRNGSLLPTPPLRCQRWSNLRLQQHVAAAAATDATTAAPPIDNHIIMHQHMSLLPRWRV
jgi:hypothetical protein